MTSVFVLSLFFAAAWASEVKFGDKYVFLENSDSLSGNDGMRLMVLTWPEEGAGEKVEGCEMYQNHALVNEVLRSIRNPRILKTNDEQLNYLIEDCNQLSQRRRKRETSDPSNSVPETYRGYNSTQDPDSWSIFPGTKWCGEGDIASNYDDLGENAEVDKCCRDHDLCPDLLLTGQSKENLLNESPYTRLSCKCDDDFYNCLMNVDSFTSNSVGNLYFNILDGDCYEKDYPLTDTCKEYYTFLMLKCKEYERDTSKPKVYEWKEAKFYSNLPLPGK